MTDIKQLVSNTIYQALINGVLPSAGNPFVTLSELSSGWGLTGNAGTVDGIDFIGTTDNIPFNIRVNNEKAGKIDHLLNNTFFGYFAGNTITIGTDNTAIGFQALVNNTIGSTNTALGANALNVNIVGTSNTAVGGMSLLMNDGDQNSGFGYGAGLNTTTGIQNTVIGYQSLYFNITGSENVAVGHNAGMFNYPDFNQCTFIGGSSNGAGAVVSNAIALGYGAVSQSFEFALPNNVTNWKFRGNSFTLPSADGTVNQALITDGSGVLSFATVGGGWGLTGNAGTVDGTNFIGTTDNIPFNIRVNNIKAGKIDHLKANVSFGQNAGASTVGRTGNTAIGHNAMQLSSNNAGVFNTRNTAVGDSALRGTSAANEFFNNTAFGSGAMANQTSGEHNIAIGVDSLVSNSSGVRNSATGSRSLYFSTNGSNNTGDGFESLWNTTTGVENAALGSKAGLTNTTGNRNTYIGYLADCTVATLSNSTAIGNGAKTSISNTMVFGNSSITDNYFTGIVRVSGLLDIRGGGERVARAQLATPFLTSLGYRAGNSTAGVNGTFVGYEAGFANTDGTNNTSLGWQALRNNTNGHDNTALGSDTLRKNGQSSNTAVGFGAMVNSWNGSENTAVGKYALNNLDNTASVRNVAVGLSALGALTIASNNCSLGYTSGGDNTTGINNTYIGHNSGRGVTTGSGNTIIGANITGLASGLTNNIIISDGAGVKRLQFDNAGVLTLTGPTVTTVGATAPNSTIAITVGGIIYYIHAKTTND